MQPAERQRKRRAKRHEREERTPRKEDDPPFPRRADRHLVVGEVLVMLAGVTIVDRAQGPDVDQAVHDVFVDPPLEQVREQEHGNHEQPFPNRILEARRTPGDHRDADGVHHRDVQRSAVARVDLSLILRPESDLPL
jgi:hypothetical protein